MALRDPIEVYNAASNLEAHLICVALRDAGLEAVAIEDVSHVGVWLGGLIPEIHKPHVWIERTDIDRAKSVLDEYERQTAERRRVAPDAPVIEVICEECGERSLFPGNQFGSVQICRYCRAFLDVGKEVPFDDWSDAFDDDEG